jgi:hypothetical protein
VEGDGLDRATRNFVEDEIERSVHSATPIRGIRSLASIVSVLPEILEPVRRHFGVTHRVHDILVAHVVLERSGVMPIVGKLVAGGVPEHVRVNRERELCGFPSSSDRFQESRGGSLSTAETEDQKRKRLAQSLTAPVSSSPVVAYAANAEEISNNKAATVSSAAHMIRSNKVASNCDAQGAAWSRGVGRCPQH